MSVYTELNHDDMTKVLAYYELGALQSFEGIAAGIENSNFFINTTSGRYVLTVFERLDADELPYFMHLMRHLAAGGLVCPDVMVRVDESLLFEVHGKQGCIVSCLSGKTLDALNDNQLRSSGMALATLHQTGHDFSESRDNPTGMNWLVKTVSEVLEGTRKSYGDAAADVLQDELKFQQSCVWDGLPKGVIHGDLFVDNILFEGDDVSGVIDFYYAHTAPYVMDVAISLNAQAVLLDGNDADRIELFLAAYGQVRVLNQDEKDALPKLLRLAAMRFWVSRLYDALFPRDGAMTQTKDPEEYRKKLLFHRS